MFVPRAVRVVVALSAFVALVLQTSVAGTYLDQLETARLVQRDQRAEFIAKAGQESDFFKFNFQVCSPCHRSELAPEKCA